MVKCLHPDCGGKVSHSVPQVGGGVLHAVGEGVLLHGYCVAGGLVRGKGLLMPWCCWAGIRKLVHLVVWGPVLRLFGWAAHLLPVDVVGREPG